MRILWFVLLALAIGCTSDSTSEDSLATLEQEVSASPTNANVTELIAVYDSIIGVSEGSVLKETLVKQYELSKKHIRLAQQISALQLLILEYPNDAETANRKFELGNAYRQTRRPVAAEIVLGSFADSATPDATQQEVLNEVLSDPRVSPDTETDFLNLLY